MKGLDIFEEIGVILVGFTIYDVVGRSEWSPLFSSLGIGSGNRIMTGLAILVICVLIAGSLSLSHRTHLKAFSGDSPLLSAERREILNQLTIDRPWLTLASAFLALASLALVCLGLGARSMFALWLGYAFVNSAPIARLLTRKT